jgi:NADH/F420H2 dehydrogenase subunit C
MQKNILFLNFGKFISNHLPVYTITFFKKELILIIPPFFVEEILYFLRDNTNCQYKILIDVCGIDFPERKNRFEVVYNLLSLRYNSRIRIKTSINEITPLNSVSHIFSTAGWYEREIWDLYGIFFSNHLNLRRILTDYGFEGHPMRKDFPLAGYVEVRYDDIKKRVICEPVEFSQEFRLYNFLTPWSLNQNQNLLYKINK